jgi:uncharacterized membrane protein YfcA
MELVILFATGAVSGLIAGLVGLAGGIVVVPALTWLYGPSALHEAIIVSWFAVLFNSIGAALKQFRIRSPEERAEIFRKSRYFLLGAVLITPLVAVLLGGAKHLVNARLVASLQICLALVMLWPVRERSGETAPRKILDASFGGLIGGVSTLIGVGGGTYTIAYFVYATKTRFQDAIATANMTGLLIGGLSVAGYLVSLAISGVTLRADAAAEPISAVGLVVLIVAGVFFSPLGVRFSRLLPTKTLRLILILALIISASRLLLN